MLGWDNFEVPAILVSVPEQLHADLVTDYEENWHSWGPWHEQKCSRNSTWHVAYQCLHPTVRSAHQRIAASATVSRLIAWLCVEAPILGRHLTTVNVVRTSGPVSGNWHTDGAWPDADDASAVLVVTIKGKRIVTVATAGGGLQLTCDARHAYVMDGRNKHWVKYCQPETVSYIFRGDQDNAPLHRVIIHTTKVVILYIISLAF